MIIAKKDWCDEIKLDEQKVKQLAKQTNLSILLTRILMQRGYNDQAKITQFLQATLEDLYDPYSLYDMQKAVQRIYTAIGEGQKIVVYGDYDVDGITSTALMYETLLQLGAEVDFYVPNRFLDGYGPNLRVYQDLIAQQTDLIITVDNGIAGGEALEYAAKQGIDVIVTDHHEIPSKLPIAYAIIHPNHPMGNYPFKKLAGVGVALKLASALLEEIPVEMLDLVALGTIADIMPLVDENRILVKYGLEMLVNTNRVGLQELYNIAKIDLKNFTSDTVGFYLGPRLNSLGRLDDASAGVELLTTFDENVAKDLAKKTNELNNKRQELTNQAMLQASAQLCAQNQSHLVNVLAHEEWHEGILGIIAGKIKEQTGKPTLVFNIGEKGIAKGSGRSLEAFDMFSALNNHLDLLESFGGHNLACGLSIKTDKLAELQMILDQEAIKQDLSNTPKETLHLAGKLRLEQLNLALIDELALLAPFGQANPKPIFGFVGYQVKAINFLGEKKNHLRLTLADKNVQVPALKFGVAQEIMEQLTSETSAIQLVGALDKNVWQNKASVQIIIEDIATTDFSITIKDQRNQLLTTSLFEQPATYGFFNAKYLKQLKPYIKQHSQACLLSQTNEINTQNLVLVDFPPDIDSLQQVLAHSQFTNLRTIFFTAKEIWRQEVPNRADFSALYRYLKQKQQILKSDLASVANQLKCKKATLIFMLQVFSEANFVKIKTETIHVVANPQFYPLEKTVAYQKYLYERKNQQFLLGTDFNELERWIRQQCR